MLCCPQQTTVYDIEALVLVVKQRALAVIVNVGGNLTELTGRSLHVSDGVRPSTRAEQEDAERRHPLVSRRRREATVRGSWQGRWSH